LTETPSIMCVSTIGPQQRIGHLDEPDRGSGGAARPLPSTRPLLGLPGQIGQHPFGRRRLARRRFRRLWARLFARLFARLWARHGRRRRLGLSPAWLRARLTCSPGRRIALALGAPSPLLTVVEIVEGRILHPLPRERPHQFVEARI
jgi:hypothetical protein